MGKKNKVKATEARMTRFHQKDATTRAITRCRKGLLKAERMIPTFAEAGSARKGALDAITKAMKFVKKAEQTIEALIKAA